MEIRDRCSGLFRESLIHPDRRAVLAGLGASMLSLAIPRAVRGASVSAEPLTHSQIEQMLKPLLVTKDPALWQFAVNIFEHCILGRIQPAEPPLKNPWLVPGGVYVGQWLWDTTFLTDLLAILPGQRNFIHGVYANFWDFQQRWSQAKPDYAQGMVANFMAPDSGPTSFSGKDWLTFPAYSQLPLLAWGIERVYARNHDLELVRQALPHLEAFHNWYWRERDLDGIGLVTVGAYSGVVQHARYETYDYEVDLDTLHLVPHPGRPAGAQNGPWYGDIYVPAITSYLLLSERSLIHLAQAAGDTALAARRQTILDKGVDAMRQYMWDDKQNCFLAVRRKSLQKLATATIGGLVPLCASVPTEPQANAMARALMTRNWNTPVPIPSVDRLDSQYKSSGFWRGDVWPSTVYQILGGLKHYGHQSIVGDLAGRLLDNALKVGVSEHYDSQSGSPLGVPYLGMSAILLTIALEGLSPRHLIHVA
jgi:hypothetical protein